MADPLPGTTRAKDTVIAEAVGTGHTYAQAAAIARVSERTVKRRMADASFRAQVHQIQDDLARQTASQLQARALEALGTLQSLLAAPSPPSIRLGAAKVVMEHTLRWQESVVLRERISALEEARNPTAPSTSSVC